MISMEKVLHQGSCNTKEEEEKTEYIAMFVVKIYTYIFLSKDIVNIYVVRAEI